MGNGCIKGKEPFPSKASRRKKDLLETKTEKIEEDLTIPEHGYPRPRPPRDRKDHIYTAGGYSDLEDNARYANFDMCVTWHAFSKYLTQGLTTDIEKVRSLFVWMGSRNFSGNIPKGKNDSPLALMRKVKSKAMSYASFFVKCCRMVGLRAVVIKGIAKSVAYDVGDPIGVLQKLRNTWCAVHVGGDWRLIFPLWAFSAVEESGTMSKTKVSPGRTVQKFNEFFFLTDPDVFVHFAFPDNFDWQLLTVPLTLERYAQEPYFRQPYFKHKLSVATLSPGILKPKHGILEFGMKCGIENWPGVLTYQLYFNKKESGSHVLPRKKQDDICKYVLMERVDGNWKFAIRFPSDGVFKLSIYGGIPPDHHEWVCDFKLICDTAIEDIPPLPCDVGAVGWGPSNILERAGITSPTQTHGTVLAKLRQTVMFGFTLTRKLIIRSELTANKYKPSDLEGFVEQRNANRELTITVKVPEDGEFGLRIYAKEKKSHQEQNVCNYLLTTDDPKKARTYKRENAYERNLRKQLVVKAQETRDPGELDKIIQRFDNLAMEDKGDLKKAKTRRDFLKIRKDLADATTRRHYGTLDHAIKKAKKSDFKDKLVETTKKAENVKNDVYSHWIHEVLEMKPSTVAELKSFKNPPPAIFDTMKAVFILLGEKQDNLSDWDDIQAILSNIGLESTLHRIRTFQTSQLQTGALEEAEKLIEHHDINSIRAKSPAAGTFYVWVRDLVDMIKGGKVKNDRKGAKSKSPLVNSKTSSVKKL